MNEPPRLDGSRGAEFRDHRSGPEQAFRTRLRDELIALDARVRRPSHLWWLVAVYVYAGVIFLLLAALFVSGGGPFGL